MGVTGLARWTNAPTTSLDLITQNIVRNHQGQVRGKWHLSIKSFRSTLSTIPGFQVHSERMMYALTMNDNVFVQVEDPVAPTRGEIIGQRPPEGQAPIPLLGPGAPTHYRPTFLTLSPPGALEQLLSQLRARWTSVRQTSGANQLSHTAGQQLTVDGLVYAIGTDFLVRAGNVILAGGAVKGMLLEAEYLPLTVMQKSEGGTMELLTNVLVSILPNIPDAKTSAVEMSDQLWDEVLWDREQAEEELANPKPPDSDVDKIFVSGDEGLVTDQKNEWTGIDRDRRSAFLIIGTLRGEGLL